MFPISQRLAAFCAVSVIAIAGTVSPAHAQSTFPDKPIRIIVPYAPGGFTDQLARLMGARMAERAGQPVIVENKPGAGTMVAAEFVARAAPDGYTLLMATTSTLSTNPFLHRKMAYKVTDFAPVALSGLTSFVLLAHPSVSAADARELVTQAKAKPGSFNAAMLGAGSSTHLTNELFRRAAQIDIRDVAYKGAGPATTDLLAGHVQLSFDAIATALPRVKSGQLKALGITADTRSPLAPEVPTFKELGMPDVVAYSWYGLVAPAATPPAVIERLDRLANESLNLPAVRAELAASGGSARVVSPRQFGELIEEHSRVWEKVIRPMGLVLD